MIQTLIARLDRVKQTGAGRWVARCPAHDSKSGQSLAIRQTDDGVILLHDFGGCGVDEVLAAVGMDVKDLFPKTEQDSVKRQRMPFSYADALRCIRFEALVTATAAETLANGHTLDDNDRARLMLAHDRITSAVEVCR